MGSLLLHPAIVFLGMASGVYIGLEHRVLAEWLSKLGDIYLSLLQMCVLPLMIAAVISSIGRLLMSGQAKDYLLRLVSVFVVGMMIVSALGVGIGVVGRPGADIDRDTKVVLGRQISASEERFDIVLGEDQRKGMLDLLHEMIPANIFEAVSGGRHLPILFFCVAVGIAVGTLRSRQGEILLSVADASYEALLKVISWIMYGLPFGLCFLFADQMSGVGVEIFMALLKLVLLLYISSLLLIFLYHMVIWLRSGESFGRSFLAFRRMFLVALGTSSSFATIPAAIQGLHRRLNFEKEAADLIIPLGISLNPHGNVLHFAVSGIFMAQLYDQSLGIGSIVTLVIVSALAAVAASGAPGIAALSMLALILEPLGLPAVVGMILLTSIDPIVDPILTVVNVYGNCAAAAAVARRG